MRIGVVVSVCALLALPLAAACVDDDFQDAQFKCDPAGGADECPPGQSCDVDGLCRRAADTADACKKRTCDEALPSCGTVDDGCGGLLDCGCWPPLSCGGGGIAGKCGCMPEQTMERSARAFWSDATLGSVAWTDPNRAGESDDSPASADLSTDAISHYLKGADFGFDLPDTAIVRGIEVVIERSASDATAINDHEVRVALDGKLLPAKAQGTAPWPASDATESYGGSDDLWGAPDPIPPSQINQPNFGMALAAIATAAGVANVDSIRIKLHVSNPACPSQ